MDKQKALQKILDIVKEDYNYNKLELTGTTTLKQLGLDELDEVEFVMYLEEAFNIEIYDDDYVEWETLENVADGVLKLIQEQN